MSGKTRESGRFIVIEGIDGSGTSTQARLLVEWLQSRGHQAALTCEPSNGPVGLLLRQILSGRTVSRDGNGRYLPIHNDVISLLFAADRVDHLTAEILPLLELGSVVVSDRYYHSSYTYQAIEGDISWIRELNARARTPDVTYLLDLPAEQAQARRQLVRTSDEIYEVPEYQKKLESAYRKLGEILPGEEIVLVDGNRDIQSVSVDIIEDSASRFGWARGGQ